MEKTSARIPLWERNDDEWVPCIQYFPPSQFPHSATAPTACVICFSGGAYFGRGPHESCDYATFFAAHGYHAFSADYHVAPHRHPLPLLDARRAVRWVRAHAEEYGIDKEKIAVVGSSAGGHLCASLCTYTDPIEGEGMDDVDREDYLPNAHILCYPVICGLDSPYANVGSYVNLMGEHDVERSKTLDPSRNVNEHTPPAFIWHTAEDSGVNAINSYTYAIALRKLSIPHELHVFPDGVHGMGLALGDEHLGQWRTLALHWLKRQFQ